MHQRGSNFPYSLAYPTGRVAVSFNGSDFATSAGMGNENNHSPHVSLSLVQGIADRHLVRDNRRLLETLLDQLDGMVYRCRHDAHWTMEFVSSGVESLTGYAPEDLLMNRTVSYEQLTDPRDRARVRAQIDAALDRHARFEVEYRLQRADGALHWVRERGGGIWSADGSLEAIQGFVQDIEDERSSREALRDAERRYRDIFENAVEGIFQSTADGRYLSVNPALARIYGYGSPAELMAAFDDIGRQLYIDPTRRDAFTRLISRNEVVTNFESQVTRRDGQVIWISENARGVRSEDGALLYYEGTVEDVSERKSYETRLAHQATHDALTGLPNRELLKDRLEQAIRTSGREGPGTAVVFVDLDNFKYVNDSMGHEAGDRLICVMAQRFRNCLREGDTVARLGGDEFVLLLQRQHAGEEGLSTVMQRILAAVSAPLQIDGRELSTTCSLGVSLCPEDGSDAEALLKHADAAMYQAKQSGRNNVQFFTKQINKRVLDRLDMEQRLRRALENSEFTLHYQPKIDLANGRIAGAEALLRWQAPNQGLVPPARFVPIAEETGLIQPIGDWVLETACAQIAAWQRKGLPALPVAVNVSARQCKTMGLVETIRATLARTGVDSRLLEIELTESCLADDPKKFLRLLELLKDIGLMLTIDDFGTGYSSMAQLKSLPVDRIKIDRAFVRGLDLEVRDQAIFRAIVSLARNLNLRTVAEGVETAGQYYRVLDSQCDEMQGYYFSMPLPAEQFEALLGGQVGVAGI